MINLLLGAPGGGKSFEAVAYHIIPALAEGRKVITNLPLILDAFPPEQRSLLDIRVRTRKPAPVVDLEKAESMFKRFGLAHREPKFNPNAFANVEDYGVPTPHPELPNVVLHLDPWRHPETGTGPLYVIDECHKPLPSASTPVAIEEWFAEHRHGFCDVLLITQSHGKINKAIKELVQVCYRVRKAVHLGFSSKYIRKVFDGISGECMNENIRTYDKKYFKFYRSHTQSGAGQELRAKDVKPIWKTWPVLGAAVLLPLGCAGMLAAGNPMDAKIPAKAGQLSGPAQPASARMSTPADPVPALAETTDSSAPVPEIKAKHPLAGYGVHISAYLSAANRAMYLFSVSQNGQAVYTINEPDLVEAGYVVKRLTDCMAQITFESETFYSTCDAPKIGVSPVGVVASNSH